MSVHTPEVLARLPFPLRPGSVARYEDGEVVIADRRRYPFEEVSVRCRDVETVAQAIRDMVTQGTGPWVAAACALVMAAPEDGSTPEAVEGLRAARDRLVATRPTNTGLRRTLDAGLAEAEGAIAAGRPLRAALLEWQLARQDAYYEHALAIAERIADLVEVGDGVLTMCFAEAPFVLGMALARERGKDPTVYTPETRPYLQGARLTAPCLARMGVRVRLVTDGMPGYLMAQGRVQKYFTAADVVTMDGHVANKIGTLLLAIAARHHGIPFYVWSNGPDPGSPDAASIVVEERDPAEIRTCRGTPTTTDDIPAYYPAFDVTPPDLVAGIVTDRGVFDPSSIGAAYRS